MRGIVGIFAIGIVVVFIFLGPICFIYDLNHLVPLITHQRADYGFNIFTLIGGWVFSEIAIPLAVLVWILVGIGVLS